MTHATVYRRIDIIVDIRKDGTIDRESIRTGYPGYTPLSALLTEEQKDEIESQVRDEFEDREERECT